MKLKSREEVIFEKYKKQQNIQRQALIDVNAGVVVKCEV